jgi:hypothetical protein
MNQPQDIVPQQRKEAPMCKNYFIADWYEVFGKSVLCATIMIMSVFVVPRIAVAQAPIIYPSKGQSLEQQAKDEGECRTWAQQQTGFNPSQGPAQVATSSGSGQVLRGAAGGAAVGAVGGAIGGSAGKGAAIGAGVGATIGLLRKGQERRANEQAQAQANAQYNQQLSNYNRAFGTCMQGRGYSIN